MPVARSDPQRATIVAVGGVAVAIVLGVIVLLAGSTASTRVTGTGAEFDAGSTSVLARRISADGGVPILFQDPARFTRPIWLQHLGEDDKTGWLAFDAAVGGCATTWDKENRQFADCSGRRYPNDGAGLGAYLVTIERDHVIVNLDPDAVTSTTAGTTTSSIQVTGG